MGNCFSHGKGRPPPHHHQSNQHSSNSTNNSTGCHNNTTNDTTHHLNNSNLPATSPSTIRATITNSSYSQKEKQDIHWETTVSRDISTSNGNTSEAIQRDWPTRSSTHHHRVSRTFSDNNKSNSNKTVSNENKINTLFDNYRDQNETDDILADGIEKLCNDLNLSPDEFRVLVLAWKFNAAQMCRFTRSEFLNGCHNLNVDTVKGIQNRLPELVSEISKDADKFKDLYRFTFRFGLDSAQGQRILPADMAVALWRLVFTVREPPILDRWLKFLEHHPHVRGIPRDTWNMFLNFADVVGDDLSMYDDTEAWPSIFDDFVEYENDQANQNITTSMINDKVECQGDNIINNRLDSRQQ